MPMPSPPVHGMPYSQRADVVEVDVAGLGVAVAPSRCASSSNAASCTTGSFCSL